MTFTPSLPPSPTTWNPNTGSLGNTWADDSITEVFDLLGDIDGNLIVDAIGTNINLLGGIVTDVASSAASVITHVTDSTVTWTAEG